MVKAVVGANWGDEGKGKITDMLAQESDIIVRFQGGANAGHTIVNNYGKFALHTLPSGVFYDHTTSITGLRSIFRCCSGRSRASWSGAFRLRRFWCPTGRRW